jgi:predicted small secreted protein
VRETGRGVDVCNAKDRGCAIFGQAGRLYFFTRFLIVFGVAMGFFSFIARGVLLAGLLLSGCNMWAGLGKDVQQAGKKMESSGNKQ